MIRRKEEGLPKATCVRHIRKMRGRAQSHLMEADDGHFYVVKFKNNPQHRRILVNELVGSELLNYLNIASPIAALIWISEAFLTNNLDLLIDLGTEKTPVQPGWHFGSRFPGDPSETAVYDFMPDNLFHMVTNAS